LALHDTSLGKAPAPEISGASVLRSLLARRTRYGCGGCRPSNPDLPAWQKGTLELGGISAARGARLLVRVAPQHEDPRRAARPNRLDACGLRCFWSAKRSRPPLEQTGRHQDQRLISARALFVCAFLRDQEKGPLLGTGFMCVDCARRRRIERMRI